MFFMRQKEYSKAQHHMHKAQSLVHILKEPESEETLWNNLGMLAKNQCLWQEAKNCYREELALNDQLGSVNKSIQACGQLGNVADKVGRPREVESWYRRALVYNEQVDPSHPNTSTLHNLALLKRRPDIRITHAWRKHTVWKIRLSLLKKLRKLMISGIPSSSHAPPRHFLLDQTFYIITAKTTMHLPIQYFGVLPHNTAINYMARRFLLICSSIWILINMLVM